MTPEQQARDMLERMGVEDAQSFTAGDLGELATLIADAQSRAGLTATDCKPTAWIGPVGQLMTHTIYEAWAPNYPDDAKHFRPLYDWPMCGAGDRG